MSEPVTIVDRNVLKVLAVDTRMDILKALSDGSRTPAFLSKRLKKSDATIVEHLDVLCKAGLVKKIEQPGKKWVFYTLTEKGEGIVSSKSRRLVIILSVSVLAGMFGTAGLLSQMLSAGYMASGQAFEQAAMPLAEKAGQTAAIPQAAAPWLLYFSIGLVALAILGFTYYGIQKMKLEGVKNV